MVYSSPRDSTAKVNKKRRGLLYFRLSHISGSGIPILQDKQPVSPRREGIMQKYTYTPITIRTRYAYSTNMSDLR